MQNLKFVITFPWIGVLPWFQRLLEVKFLWLSKMLWFPLSFHSKVDYSRKTVHTFYLSKPQKLAKLQSWICARFLCVHFLPERTSRNCTWSIYAVYFQVHLCVLLHTKTLVCHFWYYHLVWSYGKYFFFFR